MGKELSHFVGVVRFVGPLGFEKYTIATCVFVGNGWLGSEK